ncbi:MAG: hypothetical protein M3P95_04080 [Actinomycetota bacterium]|nr:hypothetical protein [Actinomycetota bacterium]
MSERVGERAGPGQHGQHGQHGQGGDGAGGGNGVKLAIAWTIVGVPLAYGISQTLIRASQLFTG